MESDSSFENSSTQPMHSLDCRKRKKEQKHTHTQIVLLKVFGTFRSVGGHGDVSFNQSPGDTHSRWAQNSSPCFYSKGTPHEDLVFLV